MTRIAVVDGERCKPEKCSRLCPKLCPINRSGEECITTEAKACIDENLCIGCGICVKKCPFAAITVVNLPEELKEEPVHSYGKNAFRLYKLPAPMPEKVVGLLGPNGVGKSTTLKIISGQLKPSSGSWDEVIRKFRGSEVQSHLEKLASGLTVSMKPQEISMIPQLYKGRASSLLERISPDLIKTLGLGVLESRDVGSLSGGELQRIAIAACLSKEADLYCIDEPGSFNDIRQRIDISRLVRAFAEEKKKPVIVVEHDIAMLDMLCDYVHILYGAPGAYGVVAGIKTTRKAINAYLEGYLAEENVRIRKDAISFPQPLPAAQGKKTLLEFESLVKKFSSFKLSVDAGTIRGKEVIGIVGANALGKTTFLKMLAGLVQPDFGAVTHSVKIAYKPQYIKAEEGIVAELLSAGSCYNEEWYKKILLSLGTQKLMDRDLKTLSGGELQRIAIALCLGQDADIIAMDEPSAFIDVETRWELARAIKTTVEIRGVAAFIVDHDIQFMDFVSDRIFIFEGIPSKEGRGTGPLEKKSGMNAFLKGLGITCRRDPQTKRPRINKPASQKDAEQKSEGRYYYE